MAKRNLVLFVLLVTSLAASAALAQTCSATNCTGCCDSSGICHKPGFGVTANAACGLNGAACVACTGQQACNAAGHCVGGTCAGCVDADGGCQSGNSDAGCGRGGQLCVACANGAVCQNGFCVLFCDPASCATGCCTGQVCVPYSQQAQAVCGTNGATCAACPANETCSLGLCTADAGAGTADGGGTDSGSGSLDGGVADAGGTFTDAGSTGIADGGRGSPAGGCGCASTRGSAIAVLLAGLLISAVRRRRAVR